MTTGTERINIKNIVIENPTASTAKFDPERDISANDWDNMQRMLRYFKLETPKRNNLYPEMLMNIHILFPDKIDLAQIENDPRAMDLLTINFKTAQSENNRSRIVSTAVPLKVLMPKNPQNMNWDLVRVFGSQISDLVGNPLEDFKQFKMGDEVAAQLVDFLASVKIIFPNQMKSLMANLDVNDSLEEAFGNFTGPIFDELRYFSSIKILIGDKKKLEIDGKSWRAFKDHLNSERGDWRGFSYIASRLKILAAEKVLVGENGIELVMDEPLVTDEDLPIPETRRF